MKHVMRYIVSFGILHCWEGTEGQLLTAKQTDSGMLIQERNHKVLFINQSCLVREKGWKKSQAKNAINESLIGVVPLSMIRMMIMVTAAATLYIQRLQVNTATDMAGALESLLGVHVKTLFMYGLFGTSFSSLIGNATVGGVLNNAV